jgi:hypothetical protein
VALPRAASRAPPRLAVLPHAHRGTKLGLQTGMTICGPLSLEWLAGEGARCALSEYDPPTRAAMTALVTRLQTFDQQVAWAKAELARIPGATTTYVPRGAPLPALPIGTRILGLGSDRATAYRIRGDEHVECYDPGTAGGPVINISRARMLERLAEMHGVLVRVPG